MATNLQVYSRISARLDGLHFAAGTTERPTNVSVSSSLKFEIVEDIANTANATLYNTSLSAFTFLWLESDYNVRVKITDTNSNTFSIWLKGSGEAGKYGVPFMLANDNTQSTYVVNTIQVFNNSGSTAKVHLIALN